MMNEYYVMRFAVTSKDEEVIAFYQNQSKQTSSNSGFDVIVTEDVTLTGKTPFHLLPLGIKCSPYFYSGYYLYPRSSICKTPLRMSNSVGIIDMNYRGEIKAPVDFICNSENDEYTITKGTRLFQICHPSLQPMTFHFVSEDELDTTDRNDGGFGSTGTSF